MRTAPPLSEAASTCPSDQIDLSETDRACLYTCIHIGRTTARVRTRAQVLLKLGEGWSLAEVCGAFGVCRNAEVRSGLPPAHGHVERRDYEYERHGAANLFVMVEPLAGWRHVSITERRAKQDYAEVLRYLVEERYPDAECNCMVQDNLNTHTAGAIYETFPPKRAHRILSYLEFHYTPKHGSWLNQAEIEISIFERGCLSRPVGDMTTLEQRVSALEAERTARGATIEWRFTSPQARVKLKKLYPVLGER